MVCCIVWGLEEGGGGEEGGQQQQVCGCVLLYGGGIIGHGRSRSLTAMNGGGGWCI